MNKYHRRRDTRKTTDGITTGRLLSCSISATSSEEADAIFEDRWKQLESTPTQEDPPGPMTVHNANLPLITHKSLRDQFMAPGALEIKRRTPVFNV